MEQYRTGKSEEGHDEFSVPLKADEDGLIGRECSNDDCETKYFKMSLTIPDEMAKHIEDFSQYDLTCPYCGTVDNMQHLHTTEQVEWIKSMMIRGVHKTFGHMLERSFGSRPKSRGGMFSISVEVKKGSLPSVRYYVEEKLKQEVTCDKCELRYAIYGVSFHCPLCGKGNILQHLGRSVETIKILVAESTRIATEHGDHVGEAMLGNALEDVIGLFEGFLKHGYRYGVRKKYPKEDADKLLSKVKVNFQRLAGAEEFFRRDLSIECFQNLSPSQRESLEIAFAKRHVLTHNLGLIDGKYKEKVRIWERVSSELVVKPDEVLNALESVQAVVSYTLGEIIPDA